MTSETRNELDSGTWNETAKAAAAAAAAAAAGNGLERLDLINECGEAGR